MASNKYNLSGKTILITGASSGIGMQAAIDISKQGGNCFITGRNKLRLQKTFGELKSGIHQLFIADLTDDSKIKELVKTVPQLDGIVHSAGITEYFPIQFIENKYIDSLMNINFKAPAILTSQLIRRKKINKNASIVFISSIATKFPYFGGALYIASKMALEGYSKALALEFSKKGIRSNCILPAFVNTPMVKNAKKTVSPENITKFEKILPLSFGTPMDVSNTIIFLLSEQSTWITGETIKLGSI